MKIITLNVNGIRSAYKKGLFAWLATENVDIVCLQEIRAQLNDLPQEIVRWNNYFSYFYPAKQNGYAGVAIYAKISPLNIITTLNNPEIDAEGRYLQLDYEKLSIVSLYLPSGSSGEDKQAKKLRFLDFYQPLLAQQAKAKQDYIICGDFNIAHQEIDLKNWRGNLKHSGFLPEEREWFSKMLNLGFTDSWRHLYHDVPGYTWWSNRGQAYAKDVGWRIDYQIVTKRIAQHVQSASIYKDSKFSDHAPLITNYTLNQSSKVSYRQ